MAEQGMKLQREKSSQFIKSNNPQKRRLQLKKPQGLAEPYEVEQMNLDIIEDDGDFEILSTNPPMKLDFKKKKGSRSKSKSKRTRRSKSRNSKKPSRTKQHTP
jgi:hypothetical protein